MNRRTFLQAALGLLLCTVRELPRNER